MNNIENKTTPKAGGEYTLSNSVFSETSQEATITSLELVELINKIRDTEVEVRHADFLVKVPKVLNGGERNFSFTYLDQQNKERPCYKLPKREATLMAMSYSYEVQAAVFDHMTKLEERLNKSESKVPQTYAQALLEAGRLALENETLATQIRIDAPKVKYFDELVDKGLNASLRDTATQLGVRQSKMIETLLRKNMLYRSKPRWSESKQSYVSGALHPYNQFTLEGSKNHYFTVKDFTSNGFTGKQLFVTPRGKQAINLILGL
ncbi:MAG: phage antirepressor KilAC domain-containing protein [Patescibacteria group bacterium]